MDTATGAEFLVNADARSLEVVTEMAAMEAVVRRETEAIGFGHVQGLQFCELNMLRCRIEFGQ
eukprot:SAG31_NODE_41201_length_277_cov_0.668539_1_plen_63_part_01